MNEPSKSDSQLATSPKKTFLDFISSDKMKAQLAVALPKHLTADRFIRVLMNAAMRQPKLLECTQESLLKGIMDCAAAGLELDGRRAHLVPLVNRKKPGNPLEANLWLDYKGIAELAMRSGVVSSIHADVVCDGDVFEVDRGIVTKHVIDYKRPRGTMYAAYCIIRMKDGGEKTEVMTKDQIDGIRARSPGKDADPWTIHYNEQAKKTVFKRASKWVPLSAEQRDVIEREDPPMTNVTDSILKEHGSLREALGDGPSPDTTDEPSKSAPVEVVEGAGKADAAKAADQKTSPAAAPSPEKSKLVEQIEGLALDLGFNSSKLLRIGNAPAKAGDEGGDAKLLKDLPVQRLEAVLAYCRDADKLKREQS